MSLKAILTMSYILNHIKAMLAFFWMRFFAGKGELKVLLTDTGKVFPSALPLFVCERLVDLIEEIANAPEHPRVWCDKLSSDTRIWGFENDIGDLVQYFELERWIGAVDAYTGRKTRSWCLMANRVIPKNKNLGSGGGLHRDSPFFHQVKCIWYLNDVGTENGPFHYLPQTNVDLIRNKRFYPLGESRFHEVIDGTREVHASAGGLLVCDTKCIHGGKPIVKGVRYAVTLYTSPKKNILRGFI